MMCNSRKSTPGYTIIENSTAQTWTATGGILQPGFILESSCADNISVVGNSMTVEHCGTYYISVTVTGTPATASSTVIPTININNIQVVSNPITGSATPTMGQFTVRTIKYLRKGDTITISNTGASNLDITGVTTPGYNVSIIIERFN